MKIGIFTDSHYSSAEKTCGKRYNSKSLAKMKEAFNEFSEKQCDLVIFLGDLTDTEATHQKEVQNIKEISGVLNAQDMKIIVLMGNHDAFTFTPDDFYQTLGEKYRPENILQNGLNLIFLDACHFKNGNHYQPGDTDWTDTFYPDTNGLKEILSSVSGNTYIFMHQNIDPDIRADHCLYNAEEVRHILEQSGKVKGVFRGHFHTGNASEYNGISYKTYPAMCETENGWFVAELE